MLALFLASALSPALVVAAPRTFTGHDGTTIRANLVGVKDGVVVLRSGRNRNFIPFPNFVLADREYIVATFNERKKPELIAQLLTAALRSPLGAPKQNVTQQRSDIPRAVIPGQQKSNQSQKLDGVPLPSPELLQLPDTRIWTDLLGRQVQAQFEKVTAEGNVALRDGYRSQKLPLVAFIRSDLEYIQQVLKDDLELEVFPPGELQPLTAEQTAAGYRVWTDRKGVTLNAKFVRHFRRDLTLEVDGTNTDFPFHGLSVADRDRVTAENKRRADAARAKAEATQAAAGASAGPSGAGMSPGQPGYRPTTPGYSPPMSNRPDYTPPTFTPPTYTPPTDTQPEFSLPEFEYEFHCDRCGHTWTREHKAVDQCPKCSGGGGAYGEGRRIGRYSGFGALIGLIGFGIRWLLYRRD